MPHGYCSSKGKSYPAESGMAQLTSYIARIDCDVSSPGLPLWLHSLPAVVLRAIQTSSWSGSITRWLSVSCTSAGDRGNIKAGYASRHLILLTARAHQLDCCRSQAP